MALRQEGLLLWPPPRPKEAGRGDRAIWAAFCHQDGWRTGGRIRDPTLG